jgi:hypothetical protein
MKHLTTSTPPKESVEPEQVCALDKGKQKRSDTRKQQCGRCGNAHTRQQSCPATGIECHKCGRKNHFAKMCWSTSRKPVHTVTHDNPSEDEDMFVATVQHEKSGPRDWHAILKINEKTVSFKIDTGAQCNVISKKTYNLISKMPLQKSHAKLVAFGGYKLKACGKTLIVCEYKGKECQALHFQHPIWKIHVQTATIWIIIIPRCFSEHYVGDV